MSHAVVVGGSVAGLLAAAAVAQHSDRVTLLERKGRPGPGESIAPQGKMLHVLLLGGARAIEALLPGVGEQLVERGARPVRPDEGIWWNGANRASYFDDETIPFASRAFVESVIRKRVEAIGNVSVYHELAVDGLVGSAEKVRGVTTADGSLDADVVIDASGRRSNVETWLHEMGAPAPPVDEIKVDVGYSGAIVPAPSGSIERHKYLVCQSMFPDHPRIGIAVAIENDQWSFGVGGYHGDRPPRDPDGLVEFAGSLAMPEFRSLVQSLELAESVDTYRFASSRRRRFERVRTPGGLVPIGDSLCSFNPVYGQGMSVAAQEAEVLMRMARRSDGIDRIDTRRAIRRFAKTVAPAWTLAAKADLGHPQTEGHGPPTPVTRWLGRVFHATTVDPRVARTMMRVTSLVDPPSALFRPATVGRTLRATQRPSRTELE